MEDDNAGVYPAPIMKNSAGFTFVEIIVVIGILFTLFGIASLSLVSTRSNVSLDTITSTLITDLSGQQIKSMVGDTEGRAANDTYGVYFEQDKYVLFHGLSYSPSDSSNFTIPIKEPVKISSILLPASSIVFSLRSGQVNGFSSLQNSITLQDFVTGEQKTITINRYGVVISVN